MDEPNELLSNIDRLHTTELGVERITRNLSLPTENLIAWCKAKICAANAVINRKGKNWYVKIDGIIMTVNANGYTVITAHKEKNEK